MLFDPACIPCVIKQAYNLSKQFPECNDALQFEILNKVCNEVQNVNSYTSAQLLSRKIQNLIEQKFGTENPYSRLKEENILKVEKYLLFLKMLIENSDDSLEMAVRTAITGNTIDLAANPDFNLDYDINRITSDAIQLSALPGLREDLKKAKTILYIGDNYEEALFDKFLIKELLPRDVVFAVRSRPILNDITMEDAKRLEIDKLCRVIESGSTIAGTDIKECTPEFLDLFNNADIVISKGQGNYETLINEVRPIYSLFKVKCSVISRKCGYPAGKGVIISNQSNQEIK